MFGVLVEVVQIDLSKAVGVFFREHKLFQKYFSQGWIFSHSKDKPVNVDLLFLFFCFNSLNKGFEPWIQDHWNNLQKQETQFFINYCLFEFSVLIIAKLLIRLFAACIWPVAARLPALHKWIFFWLSSVIVFFFFPSPFSIFFMSWSDSLKHSSNLQCSKASTISYTFFSIS